MLCFNDPENDTRIKISSKIATLNATVSGIMINEAGLTAKTLNP
jgi:hypothetical protein